MMHDVRFVGLVAFVLGAAALVPSQSVPHELAGLASAARLDRPIVAWCRGEFRTGHSGAYALAVADATGGGRYLVLESGSTAVELAAFSGGPDIESGRVDDVTLPRIAAEVCEVRMSCAICT